MDKDKLREFFVYIFNVSDINNIVGYELFVTPFSEQGRTKKFVTPNEFGNGETGGEAPGDL